MLSSLSLQLDNICQTGVYTLFRGPKFLQLLSPDHLLLVVSRAYLVVPQDCIYLHTLKAAS